jgi:hypothetical protein
VTDFLSAASIVQLPGGEAFAGQVLVETKQSGVAYQSRVQVADRRFGTLFWLGKTDTAGKLRVIVPVEYTTKNDLLVTALDDTGTYDAVVADRVQAELMP